MRDMGKLVDGRCDGMLAARAWWSVIAREGGLSSLSVISIPGEIHDTPQGSRPNCFEGHDKRYGQPEQEASPAEGP